MILLKGWLWSRTVQGDFESERDAREAWEEHREMLMGFWLQSPEDFTWPDGWNGWNASEPRGPGTRPDAWWRFDAPEPKPEDETETEYLKRHGLLAEEELAWLEAQSPEGGVTSC